MGNTPPTKWDASNSTPKEDIERFLEEQNKVKPQPYVFLAPSAIVEDLCAEEGIDILGKETGYGRMVSSGEMNILIDIAFRLLEKEEGKDAARSALLEGLNNGIGR